MRVNAHVVDLRRHQPQPTLKYVLDTNVWLDLTYARHSLTSSERVRKRAEVHSEFVKAALDTKTQLLWSAISFAEMAHVIEKSEFEIAKHDGTEIDSLKKFRGQKNSRLKTLQHIKASLLQVESLGAGIPLAITMSDLPNIYADFANSHVDGYDSLLISSALAAGYSHIVTDDADFISWPGLTVYTCNEFALHVAQNSGKLVS